MNLYKIYDPFGGPWCIITAPNEAAAIALFISAGRPEERETRAELSHEALEIETNLEGLPSRVWLAYPPTQE